MTAAAYDRSRPSGPEASDLALRIQHEAVCEIVEESGFDMDRAVVGERPEKTP